MKIEQNLKWIDISGIKGNIKIIGHDEDFINIKTDREDLVKVNGKNLIIAPKSKTSKKGFNIFGKNNQVCIGGNNVIQSSGSITIINGQIVQGNNITINSEIVETNIDIFVPKNTIKEIDLSIDGYCEIRDVSDDLGLDTSGITKVDLYGSSDIKIDSSGMSEINIDTFKNLNLDSSGQSKIKAGNKELECNNINIDSSGMGHIDIYSKSIQKTDIDISGMCHVYIVGEIKIRNVDKSGMSHISFN